MENNIPHISCNDVLAIMYVYKAVQVLMIDLEPVRIIFLPAEAIAISSANLARVKIVDFETECFEIVDCSPVGAVHHDSTVAGETTKVDAVGPVFYRRPIVPSETANDEIFHWFNPFAENPAML